MRLYEYDERSLLASIPICISECPSCLSRVIQSITHCLAVLGHIYNLAAQKLKQAIPSYSAMSAPVLLHAPSNVTCFGFFIPFSNELQTAEFVSLILVTQVTVIMTTLAKEVSWVERRVLGAV